MDSIISILVKQFNMRQQCSTPPNTRWVEESLTPAVRVVCSTLLHHSQVTQRILCVSHHHHAAWSQETLLQKGRLIFSQTLREWLKNRHQTGLIKNRRPA